MKWSVGDKVLYKYRPDKKRFGDNDVDYYGEIVDITNHNGYLSIEIKFDNMPEICSYDTDSYVVRNMELLNSKFKDNNPNRTFRGKYVGK